MLEINNLSKRFGTVQALNDLNMTVNPGEIMGLIGQNGAGKSTTFRLMLNFITADQGVVKWNNQKLDQSVYNQIGYLPEERGLYPKLSIEEQILFFGELRGKKRSEIEPKINAWMDRFEVKGKRKDKIKSLSKGNQQKVQIITTLIHEPQLIILDEPFSGLDPVNASMLKDAIIDVKQSGAAIIISSHNMDNVEEMCDRLTMLKKGQRILYGTIEEIRSSFERLKLVVETPLPASQLQLIDGVNHVQSIGTNRYRLLLNREEVGKEVFNLVTKDGYIPVFSQQPPTLDEIFRMKVGESNE
ncbi:ABC transporter ATP-binding protein [Atopobacter phocae]|uniref:ABC transporter ATP-binding protein n=1 Tax=Atopobacter phocae TaxID=136492 RepID=UPI000470CE18|nr:ABC transporter ATP-binding protein [Atopobacter phocae]